MKHSKPARPENSATQPQRSTMEASGPSAAVLLWSGALAAAALMVVPLWMLFGNPAVLGGHPALPALLLAAVASGLAWAFVLFRRAHRVTQQGPEGRGRPGGRKSLWKLLRGFAGRVAVVGLVAGLAWLGPFPYRPGGGAGQTTGTTTEDATSITLVPQRTSTAGLVFYPGARVDAQAYQDILGPLADAGYLVVILKVPLGISLLDAGQARGAMDRHPGITSWAVGGHSLGGVSAASFAKSNPDVAGLLLFASYPVDNMADTQRLSVLSISGSNDGLSTAGKVAASKALLPPTAAFATVDGGVHAFFGDYGEQPGDGEPGIPREQAQQQITAQSVRFLDRLHTAG